MLDTLKVQLGLAKDPADVKDGVIYIGGGKSEVTLSDEEKTKSQEFVPQLKDVEAIYTKMAAELCDGQDAEAVLANVLSVTYGKSLDESHYGKITPVRPRNEQGGRRGERGMGGRRFDVPVRSDQKRLFIQLGRRDGYNAKSIAQYFSDLLHIPGRMVDRIDVADNFSLVSLPIANADKVLELSRMDGRFPHVHVDTKSGDGSRRGGRDFGGRDRFDRDGGDRGRRFGGRGFGRDRDRRDGGKERSFGRRAHAQTQRNGASSYKKSNAPSNEF